ncbi:MAG TPA: sigma-E factor regulatory protein RseB domain-containing protein [Intrasporangium sp.]|uniref:LolA family protein n=1 Tax=Intrasporangium sp. TaxID=1925024 RepID=UPI002D788055|nr:sigma-E factor regulatory protein RseB domain-containing protein [Intrasporangium sp.]HET7397412.1 sigma-E factor regulatory protein RseB domain-containing protein [Intrasporangium sp.]
MTYFASHPAARWALPVAAVALIGGTTLALNRTAYADAGLPARTAAQLLADVQHAQVEGLSGTVVQTADLGLPQVPGAAKPGGGQASLTSLVSGTHTWRVWFSGPDQQRLALVGALGESDVIRNGSDVWVWSSTDKTAVHSKLPAHAGTPAPAPDRSALPRTPDEAARLALDAMSPTTQVTTSGTAVVAGRDAYELVLAPRDRTTRVAQVRIAIDAEKHLPLRVQVYSTKAGNPAFEVGFTAVDFARPDARQFAFNPPPGTAVTESGALKAGGGTNPAPSTGSVPPVDAASRPRVVGTGWSSVVVAKLPALPAQASGSSAERQLDGVLRALPRASGSWGSGRVLDGTLVSAVVSDDGRVAIGAVGPDQLYAALAAR